MKILIWLYLRMPLFCRSSLLLVSFSLWSHAVLCEGASHGEAGEHDKHEEEPKKGSHGGRLLEKEGFQIEVTIFEKGIPPQFRLYAYEDGKSLDPKSIIAKITLTRLGNRTSHFDFLASNEYLSAEKTVEEPHSFDVTVDATWNKKSFTWTYPSYEGRTELASNAVQQSGVVIEESKETTLKMHLPVNGRIVPDEDHLVHVSPRFPGIVKEVKKRLGDHVNQGDLLAVIESNVNLQRYEIRSLLSGTVVKKDITIGEFVSEKDTIYIVADLRNVWVDLNVYRQDFPKIKVGQELKIHAAGNTPEVVTKLSYISPFGSENTQSMLARGILANPTGEMLPGLFVTGELMLEAVMVPVAVRAEAIQKFRDWDVVFIQEGNFFEALPVELGRNDGEWVEVISGMKAGQKYVTKNSFIIKADILKSGASHDH